MEEFLASAPPNLTNMAQWARSGFLSEHLVRPGEDGDIVYRGFTDTSFLDLVSHCLKRSPPGESRFGDFEPSHRCAAAAASSMQPTHTHCKQHRHLRRAARRQNEDRRDG
jgi:hypothetical protein